MPSSQTPMPWALLAAHLCLAISPIGMVFVPFSTRTLPILWVLASIPIAQFMLLSVWIGMTRVRVARRIALAILASLFISLWPAFGDFWMNYQDPSSSLLSAYWRYAGMMLVFLVVLSTVMAGASRFVGTIRMANQAELNPTESRPQYSLFALLALTTTTALILGLTRSSQEGVVEGLMIAQWLLFVVVFLLLLLTTVWATLGQQNIRRRLAAVFFVSIILGLSLAIGSGNTLETVPWWLFAATTLIAIVPTTIVAITLLVLRTQGYRLLPRPKSAQA